MSSPPRAYRAEPEDDPPPPPRARRREAPPPPPPRPRKGGWWWTALVLSLLMVLVLGVSAIVALAVEADRRAQANRTYPPPARSNTSYPPFADAPPGEATDDEVEEVRAFFRTFGKAVNNPDGLPYSNFDFIDFVLNEPVGVVEPDLPGVPEEFTGPHRYARRVVTNELAEWLRWEWGRAEVRRVSNTGDGRYEAVVWHPTKAGGLRKVRWTLTRPPGDPWQVLDWEDLGTGITGTDRGYALAAADLPSARGRQQTQFTRLRTFHQHLSERKWKEAGDTLRDLKAVRWDDRVRYAVDVADARYALAGYGYDEDADFDLAAEIAEELTRTNPNRLAAYLVLAEARLGLEEYEAAAEACGQFLAAVGGNDADAHALRGAARLKLLQTDDAVADFTLALHYDPHHPRALDWKRQTADPAGKQKLADVLTTAPDPPALFDTLAEKAEADSDWVALTALAEKYHALRSKEARGVERLAVAHAHEKRTAAAGKLLADALPALPAEQRAEVVRRFAWAMISSGQAAAAYPLVPAADAPAAFRVLAGRVQIDYEPVGDEGKRLWAANVKDLKALVAQHAKKHPADVWLAVYDGKVKNAEGEHAEAAEVLAAALAKLPFADDFGKDVDSGYVAVRDELLVSRYKTGRGAEVLKELRPPAVVFPRLAQWHVEDKDAAGLGKLLAARPDPDARDAHYWQAELHRLKGKHAEAVAEYRKHLKSFPDDAYDPNGWQAQDRLVRCLVKAGDAAAAVKETDGHTTPTILRVLALTADGQAAEANRQARALVGRGEGWVRSLYADDDLGPLLKTDPAFAAFRDDYPPPADR